MNTASAGGVGAGGMLARAWALLRQVTGEAAYENYVRHAERCGPTLTREAESASLDRLLTRKEFYVDSLRRRYSAISRCC
jgi:uncharacterized short protein YbdD (DUF466 family)